MLERFREHLHQLRADEPGQRFERYYHRRMRSGGGYHRVLLVILGVVVILVGIVMLPAPGPGTVVIAGGLGILSGESLFVARRLDRSEVWLRARWQRWRARR